MRRTCLFEGARDSEGPWQGIVPKRLKMGPGSAPVSGIVQPSPCYRQRAWGLEYRFRGNACGAHACMWMPRTPGASWRGSVKEAGNGPLLVIARGLDLS